MRVRPAPLLAWCLALLLAAGGVAFAAARGVPPAAGIVTLCAGGGEAVLAVDARGRPVAPAHPCPDCLPHAPALTAAEAPGPARPAARARRARRRTIPRPAAARPDLRPPVRGPPACA